MKYWSDAPGVTIETYNILPNVPGYVPADWNGGITDISDARYITASNVRAGKGDPCRLIGYTADEIRNMSNSTLVNVLANAKYRMPSKESNAALVGTAIDSTWASLDKTDHWIANDANTTNPAVAAFPLDITPRTEGSYNLVAANDSTGAVVSQGERGSYWASNAITAMHGYSLNFTSTTVGPLSNFTAASALTVRCLPQ